MKTGHDIYHDFEIKASIEKVFDSITNPAHLINWWPLRCTGTPQCGQEYNFFFTPEYDWYGEVVKVEVPNSFYIQMTHSDNDWNSTSFGFDLTQIPNGVLVQFWHKNWPECNAHFRRSSYCWAILLRGLKIYVETGEMVPFEDRE